MVSGIVRRLENMGENDIQSQTIGRLVMEALKSLDDVAYVRFASVYRNFREAKDFHDVPGELKGDEEPGCTMVASRRSASDPQALDGRYMAAEPGLSRRHAGRPSTLPAVGTPAVTNDVAVPLVVPT